MIRAQEEGQCGQSGSVCVCIRGVGEHKEGGEEVGFRSQRPLQGG